MTQNPDPYPRDPYSLLVEGQQLAHDAESLGAFVTHIAKIQDEGRSEIFKVITHNFEGDRAQNDTKYGEVTPFQRGLLRDMNRFFEPDTLHDAKVQQINDELERNDANQAKLQNESNQREALDLARAQQREAEEKIRQENVARRRQRSAEAIDRLRAQGSPTTVPVDVTNASRVTKY